MNGISTESKKNEHSRSTKREKELYPTTVPRAEMNKKRKDFYENSAIENNND